MKSSSLFMKQQRDLNKMNELLIKQNHHNDAEEPNCSCSNRNPPV